MSNSIQSTEVGRGAGFSPAKTSRVSFADLRELKEILKDPGLTKWIVLAGIGGFVELIRALVDVVRYLHKF
jgi:hypothetical protein